MWCLPVVLWTRLVFVFTAPVSVCFFFFNDTATTEIYTLSLHDALPISNPAFGATTIHRPIALAGSIVETAPALGHPTLDTNGPRHTPPPFLGVMYFSSRSNGSDHRSEAISA